MIIGRAKPDRAAWLKGGGAHCNVVPDAPGQPRRLVLLGPPGVGKGTQAELLAVRLGACHLSTGDVFRNAKKLGECDCTPTVNNALEHMRRGDLVPDEIVLGLVVERSRCLRCKGGFLLDGFPRTLAQAEALDKLLINNDVRLDAVLNYDLPLENIVARLSGRRICAFCKAVFHIEWRPSKIPGICDRCGSDLHQRPDDLPESIRVRMLAYEHNAAPLTDFYRRKSILVSVLAEGSPEEIFEHTLLALQKQET